VLYLEPKETKRHNVTGDLHFEVGEPYVTVLETNSNGDDVRGNPLRKGVHFFKAAATVGDGARDFVYEDCPS
jgi:hypothetical protein